MSMKKVLAFGLAAAMVFSLAACGSSSGDSTATTDTDTAEMSEEDEEKYRELCDEVYCMYLALESGDFTCSYKLYSDGAELFISNNGEEIISYDITEDVITDSMGNVFSSVDEVIIPDVVLAKISGDEGTSEEGTENSGNSDYVLTANTWEGELDGGYTYNVTVSFGQWVKTSDEEIVNVAWQAVGGEGSAPTAEDFSCNSSTSVMVFGTCKVDDTTQGDFRIYDSSNSLRIGISTPDYYPGWKVSGAAYLSNKTVSSETKGMEYQNILIYPSMESDSWGPIPFVFCIGDVFSPEYPDGDPAILDLDWDKSEDGELYLSPSWQ